MKTVTIETVSVPGRAFITLNNTEEPVYEGMIIDIENLHLIQVLEGQVIYKLNPEHTAIIMGNSSQ